MRKRQKRNHKNGRKTTDCPYPLLTGEERGWGKPFINSTGRGKWARRYHQQLPTVETSRTVFVAVFRRQQGRRGQKGKRGTRTRVAAEEWHCRRTRTNGSKNRDIVDSPHPTREKKGNQNPSSRKNQNTPKSPEFMQFYGQGRKA